MKAAGLETVRMRLTAICTVCIKAFLNEVQQMDQKLRKIGPVNQSIGAERWRAAQQELRAGLPAKPGRTAPSAALGLPPE